tara:strand:+ start:463 stop:876 length:414 start_codon:yes stop_codon:yes gene_type:complete
MSVRVTNVPQRLAETLVIDSSADATTGNASGAAGTGENIFSGTSGATKFYAWKIDGTQATTAFYVKVQEATTYTQSTNSHPSYRFYCPAGQIVHYLFPEGQTFSTGISFIATTTAATSAASQTAPTGTVSVTVLGGT